MRLRGGRVVSMANAMAAVAGKIWRVPNCQAKAACSQGIAARAPTRKPAKTGPLDSASRLVRERVAPRRGATGSRRRV